LPYEEPCQHVEFILTDEFSKLPGPQTDETTPSNHVSEIGELRPRKNDTMIWSELLLVVGFIAFAIILPVLVVKFMVQGLITMRHANKGGGAFVSGLAGAMTEMDRFTRPSIQYIEHVSEKILEEDEIDGE